MKETKTRPMLNAGLLRTLLLIGIASNFSSAAALAQTPEKTGVIRGLRHNSDAAAPGYVLYARGRMVYLINREGLVVHTWTGKETGGSVYLLDNGNLLRRAEERNAPVFKGGGQGGRLQEFSWDGELLWDWKYANEQHLLHHDIRWIEKGFPGAGHLLVFNNNVKGPDGAHSAVYELLPPILADGSYEAPSQGSFGPTRPVWKYEAPDKKSFHSNYISGARRQPNGNTLICSGADGRFFEVTKEGKIVWEFWEPFGGQVPLSDGPLPNPDSKPNHSVFRATKISPEHPALAGRDLKPLDPQPQSQNSLLPGRGLDAGS